MSHQHGGPRTAVAAVFARQFGTVSRAQALEAGVTRRQIDRLLANGEWIRSHDGIYRLPSAPVTDEQRVLAGCLASGGVVSHRSAALLHELDVRPPVTPEITARTHLVLEGVTVHQTRRLPSTQIEVIEPFCVTRPPRTLLDLAAVLPAADLGPAVDSAVRSGLITLDALERCIDGHGARGFSGAARLRAIIDERRLYGISRSRLEDRVWTRFAAADIPTPVRNEVVHDERGRRLGELDVCWPCCLVGVECQSYRYHFDRDAWRRDQVKFNRFTAAGWRIFPATEAEAGPNFPVLLAQVRHALANCGP